jgi:hypothetical protein
VVTTKYIILGHQSGSGWIGTIQPYGLFVGQTTGMWAHWRTFNHPQGFNTATVSRARCVMDTTRPGTALTLVLHIKELSACFLQASETLYSLNQCRPLNRVYSIAYSLCIIVVDFESHLLLYGMNLFTLTASLKQIFSPIPFSWCSYHFPGFRAVLWFSRHCTSVAETYIHFK